MGTTKGMTLKVLLDVGIYKEAWNQKILLTYLAWFVNYRPKSRKSRLLMMHLLGMITSRNFAGLSTSEINPENFRWISQRLAILQNNL